MSKNKYIKNGIPGNVTELEVSMTLLIMKISKHQFLGEIRLWLLLLLLTNIDLILKKKPI